MGGFFIRIFLPLFYGGVGVVYGDIQPVFLFFFFLFWTMLHAGIFQFSDALSPFSKGLSSETHAYFYAAMGFHTQK